MQNNITILMAQINPRVGDLDYNCNKIINTIRSNQHQHDIIIFPELALTGYPPEDLLFRQELFQQVEKHLQLIQPIIKDCHVLIGHPVLTGNKIHNSVSLFHNGTNLAIYHKQNLPNYEIFDEARYFTAGPKHPFIFNIKKCNFGVCICEDAWQPGPIDDLIHHGASIILSLNASPFEDNKYARRENLLRSYAKQGVGIVYVNQVGGQDELLFDGQSMAMDSQGIIQVRAPAFIESLLTVSLNHQKLSGTITPLLEQSALLYNALVCGVKDYVSKNNFPGVLLGLSGGIDSALTLAIAVDALGAEKVHAVLMPSRFTANISVEDAMKQLASLNVSYTNLSIEPAFNILLETVKPEFTKMRGDISEENIQARIRGLLLMALSNNKNYLVLNTSNKSECAVGYTTLYGDMCGGLAVLKDVFKTQVYELARYRNSISVVIPERVLVRAPSAELRENQTDQDSLPSYDVLDAILTAYIEKKLSVNDIVHQGYDETIVKQIIYLIKKNEYKRRQSAPGIKISKTAFGKDWRFPITNGFNY